MISILMSVCNETQEEIRQSLDSILEQSFSDFELIIVLDQPSYIEALNLLQEYSHKDDRVQILVNEKNIGLALSMNRAAEHASGEYLLRMDADDICLPERFRLEYDAICDGKYDLVCGNYDFIDENGALLPQKPVIYSQRQISALLPLRNVIHHPTVIMTAEMFHRVGGYRNYPCAQDYDLWLRMKCAGARMYMLPDKLIQYRVRPGSTTSQKRYKQSCTGDYIRQLYHRKDKMSGYSYEGYLAYLDQRGVNRQEANAEFIENFEQYAQAKRDLKCGHLIRGVAGLCRVLFCSRYYRPRILQSIRIAAITKFMN